MLNWFTDWSKTRPFDYITIIAQVSCGAALVAGVAYFVIGGSPTPREVAQTGPRGTGMVDIAYIPNRDAKRAANVLPESEPPIKPEPGAALAKDVYQNVPTLGHLSEENFNRLMLAVTEWVAPEEGCNYCHNPENMAEDNLYTKVVARKMFAMTWAINEDWDGHVVATGVTCYTCHRGNPVPKNIWFDPVPTLEAVTGASLYQNSPMAANAYTSLPVNAMRDYLKGDESSLVQSETPRALNKGSKSIQDTEKTYSLMMRFSTALGVNCTYCHNSRAFQNWEESTPQRALAKQAIPMVQEINNAHLAPLKDTLPAHRLGPTGDAPNVACVTCHQGAAKPLLGQSMLPNWPELASSTPTYE